MSYQMNRREKSVVNAIRDTLTEHMGEYKGNAVDLGLALSMIAQAMKHNNPETHQACARAAIDFLIQGGFLLENKTVPMPKLEA